MKEMLIDKIILWTRKSEVKKKKKNRMEGDWWLKMIVGLFQYTVGPNNYSKDAKIVRDGFSEYFNSNEVQVSWQRDMVSVENY